MPPACVPAPSTHRAAPPLCPARRRGPGRAGAAPLLPAPRARRCLGLQRPELWARTLPGRRPCPACSRSPCAAAPRGRLALVPPQVGRALGEPRGCAREAGRASAPSLSAAPASLGHLKETGPPPPSPQFPRSLRRPSIPRCRQLPPGGVSHSRGAPVSARPGPAPPRLRRARPAAPPPVRSRRSSHEGPAPGCDPAPLTHEGPAPPSGHARRRPHTLLQGPPPRHPRAPCLRPPPCPHLRFLCRLPEAAAYLL